MTLFDQIEASIKANTLDEAVAPIQALLGQTDGGYAARYFGHRDEKNWVRLGISKAERRSLLDRYIGYEIAVRTEERNAA